MPKGQHILSTLKHASVYGIASILQKLLGFIMLPVYAHYLRGEGYGIVGMIDVVLTVLAVLIGYGVTGAMSRFYFEKESEQERKVLVSTAILLMFVIVVVVCTPALLLASPISRLAFGEAGQTSYIVLAVLAFIAEMTSKNAQSYILIKQKSIFFSALALLRLFIGFFLNIYFIVMLEMGIIGYLYASLAVSLLFTLIMHGYALRDTGLHYSREDARAILRFSLPLVPGYIAFFIRGNADRVLLRIFQGLATVGAFEMLFKFATLIGVLIVEPFTRIWGVKQLEICEKEEGPATMARIFTLQLAVMLFFGLLLSLEIPLILRLLTPPEFWLGGVVAFFAVTSRILIACYTHMSFGLFYAKQTGRLSFVQFITAGINVALNLLLIPHYGILGAVTASVTAAFFHGVWAYILSYRLYYIPFEWGKVVRMAGLYLGMFLLFSHFSLETTEIGRQINTALDPLVRNGLALLQVDQLRDGRIAGKILENLPLAAECLFKLALALLFIPALFGLRIFSTRDTIRLVQGRFVSRSSQAFSEP